MAIPLLANQDLTPMLSRVMCYTKTFLSNKMKLQVSSSKIV